MHWYEDEVKRIEAQHMALLYEPETIFYGSSSIRLWLSLYEDFPQIKPVNLGFGGSTLAACVWFFDRIMKPYHPERIIMYAGDNDLGDGRHPEEVFIFFQQLVARIQQRFGNLHCYYVSLKPSPGRWHIAGQFKYTNSLIKNEIVQYGHNWQFIDVFNEMLSTDHQPDIKYFDDDGLHLNNTGYNLWKDIISKYISAKP